MSQKKVLNNVLFFSEKATKITLNMFDFLQEIRDIRYAAHAITNHNL